MKLGAQLYTVRDLCQNEKDFAATLQTIAEIGYHSVQISGVNLAAVPPQTVRRICDDLGLEIVVSHTAPERLLGSIEEVIADHQVFGARYVGLGMMPKRYIGMEDGPSHDAVWVATRVDTQRFLNDFNPVIDRLAEAGLKFVYHNHHFEFLRQDGVSIFDQLLAGFDPANVDILLDTFWIQFGGGDVVAWIDKLTGRLPVVHFKDLAIVNSLELDPAKNEHMQTGSVLGCRQIMAPIGQGNLNFPGILAACKRAGTQHILVEQDICQIPPLDALRESYNYLKSIGLS